MRFAKHHGANVVATDETHLVGADRVRDGNDSHHDDSALLHIWPLIGNLPTLYRIDWVGFAKVSERFRSEALRSVKVIYE